MKNQDVKIRRIRVDTAILAAVLLSTSSALAWDGDGHMQVAEIAWKHLTTASRARVSALLELNPNYHTWLVTVQDAGESRGDLARLQWLGEQLADTRNERLTSQSGAAITAHQHDGQVGPLAM